MDKLQSAVAQLASAGIDERGAVFTRREVVEFILDLTGYTTDSALQKKRFLEPSFGEGAFLLIAVERLLASYFKHTQNHTNLVAELKDSIRAVELHQSSFNGTRMQLSSMLKGNGISQSATENLLDTWLIHGDFLLADFPFDFTHIVGNPPYVRQEMIPDILLAEYRHRFDTLYDRADLYIPFIEHSLKHLGQKGSVGFICSDRWMKNRYGGPLRQMVAKGFHLKYYVDMVNTDAFHSEVSAYPAITVISKELSGATRITHRPQVDKETLVSLAHDMRVRTIKPNSAIHEVSGIMCDNEPWVLESFDQLTILRRIESVYPTLEEAGCKVGIGVATGADKVYVGEYRQLDVEKDRKLPLVMTKDIRTGKVEWRGMGVVNPFNDDGSLVDLKKYPKLAAYLNEHKAVICNRNVAKRSSERWYRTIDRITPKITHTPKLLIPDIKGEANIVYEEGKYYPHHNLYYITSETWDLKALQAVLLSDITRVFITTYSTKMRGGYLRFQAQYLRRIHIPRWQDVPEHLKKKLRDAADIRDIAACNALTCELYNLSAEERAILSVNDDEGAIYAA
ncbi:MAG: Eco57I restriction-modification methylase domain-containing protein [Nitrospirota bacterium]|nr:Eco57I restriction-modification methylase domain-containing protein [Nitrospirota bacterium]